MKQNTHPFETVTKQSSGIIQTPEAFGLLLYGVLLSQQDEEETFRNSVKEEENENENEEQM